MTNKRSFLLSVSVFALAVSTFGEEYIIVGKDAKVFDEPNAKGYVTLNRKNEEVILTPGMIFKTLDNSKGWYIIEYSPGLRGYLSEQCKVTSLKAPAPGSYVIANYPSQKLDVSGEADNWTATVGDTQYKGKTFGKVLVFLDGNGKMAYSLVDIGDGPIAISYDNTVTNFF